MARLHRLCANVRFEFAAAPNNNSIVGESKPQSAESNFETGSRFIIASEQVRHSQSVRIERAAERNAELAKTRPP